MSAKDKNIKVRYTNYSGDKVLFSIKNRHNLRTILEKVPAAGVTTGGSPSTQTKAKVQYKKFILDFFLLKQVFKLGYLT